MKRPLILLVGLILFHLFFWHEGVGLNWALFSLISLIYLRGSEPFTRAEAFYALPYLAAVIGLLSFHTIFSILGLALTFIPYVGFLANRQNSVVENTFSAMVSFLLRKHWRFFRPDTVESPRWQRVLTISIIPLLITVLFYLLLRAGNSIFMELSDRVLNKFAFFWQNIDFEWVMFILLGTLVVHWAMERHRNSYNILSPGNVLQRERRKQTGIKSLDLKREYQAAILLFASLNAMFLVVNIIDINYVWFQIHIGEAFSLKEFVHEGVGWLIFTTLVSAVVLIFYFRRNLNFFPNNKRLVLLAQIWVAQNIILAISVAIRAFHYINFHGLAPLRIGVLLFVVMILVSMVAVGWKITQTKNLSWVIRTVSTAGLVVLGISSIIPWNHWVAQVNLNHEMANEIDVDYYLELGPELYPTLYQNLDVIERQIVAHSANESRWVHYTSLDEFTRELERRAERFIEAEEDNSVFSWSWARHRAYKRLTGSPKPSELAMSTSD